MKFNDYKYSRPDLKEIEVQFKKAIETISSSTNLDEVINTIDEINKTRNTYSTMQSLCYIRASLDTTDKFYEEEQNFFDENSPVYSSYEAELSKVLVESKLREGLEKKYGMQWFRLMEANLKVFSPEIIEDLQEENRLTSEYRKLSASAQIEFDGKINNLSQMGPYAISLDRDVRRNAETKVMEFFAANEEKYDELYDKLVQVRTKMARKLGFENYVDFGYLRLGRTDYDSKMVANYRKQVLEDLVPVASIIYEDKAKRLGIKDLKSYDLGVDFKSGNPKPVGDKDHLVKQASKMYQELSKETGEFFDFMVEHELLELEAKKGKAGGGFCTYINDYRSPFIYSNFNGTSGDIDVLTHEAGHAFQVYSSRDFEIPEYMFPTYEACEIHSMSMEFFAWPWMELFFLEDADRYRYHHLAGTITFIPYGVLVDHFQTVVYENPGMTKEERKAKWRELEKMYLPHKVYENEFLEKGTFWFRQSHIFSTAFYYIDYTLAQVCAQQYWVRNNQDKDEAWKSYLKLCKQGGSKSFLELVEVAELDNPFVDGTVKKVASHLVEYLKNFDQSKLG
ncbi:MAG: M3 family oligoendopeptidase [Bacilli bacterium]